MPTSKIQFCERTICCRLNCNSGGAGHFTVAQEAAPAICFPRRFLQTRLVQSILFVGHWSRFNLAKMADTQLVGRTIKSSDDEPVGQSAGLSRGSKAILSLAQCLVDPKPAPFIAHRCESITRFLG